MTEHTSTIDQTVAEAFGERFVDMLNSGALCLMVSLGHRSALFDTMATQPPATVREIAIAAGLNERYVREWLGAMVTGGVVNLDPVTEQYQLPAEHASLLTRAAGADNLAVFAQYIGLLGGVEDEVLQCFRHGGGVTYERFPRFHEVMAEESGQSVLPVLESHIVPLVPGLHQRLISGIDVLDVGCGRGRAMTVLAAAYPQSRFVGYDLSHEAISHANAAAADAGLTNLRFVARDLSDFDSTAEPDSFDFVTTFDAVHDQAKPLNVLKGIRRTLRPDGVYLMQDIRAASHHSGNVDHPLGPLLYTVSTMHCMTVSLAQGGEGVGAMWGEEMTYRYLHEAGFGKVETHTFEHDIQNNWYLVRI